MFFFSFFFLSVKTSLKKLLSAVNQHLLSGSAKTGLRWILLSYLFLFFLIHISRSPAPLLLPDPPGSSEPQRTSRSRRRERTGEPVSADVDVEGNRVVICSLCERSQPGCDFGGFV